MLSASVALRGEAADLNTVANSGEGWKAARREVEGPSTNYHHQQQTEDKKKSSDLQGKIEPRGILSSTALVKLHYYPTFVGYLVLRYLLYGISWKEKTSNIGCTYAL